MIVFLKTLFGIFSKIFRFEFFKNLLLSTNETQNDTRDVKLIRQKIIKYLVIIICKLKRVISSSKQLRQKLKIKAERNSNSNKDNFNYMLSITSTLPFKKPI